MDIKTKKFIHTIRRFYKMNCRDLLWRRTRDPYRILISEVMLQQTQVKRVMEKYPEFLKRFPSLRALAKAPLADVLTAWQGMGYNRRAKMLHTAARAIITRHKGEIPNTQEGLLALPGIGQSTAGGVLAFAYNKPSVFIETNIRRVYIHHFFPHKKKVSNKDVVALIENTVDTKNPREWYWALMDHGAYLAKTIPNPNRKSRHYAKQAPFKGSNREVRGKVIALLAHNKTLSLQAIRKNTGNKKVLRTILNTLAKEGFLEKTRRGYSLMR